MTRLRNVFCTNARSKVTYKYFDDVVTYDTTKYLTNKYEIHFAVFVGVNHYDKSIFFRVALISSQDTKIFTCLFETWLKCINGKALKAIITYQAKVMKNVIALVFPTTRHRYYL